MRADERGMRRVGGVREVWGEDGVQGVEGVLGPAAAPEAFHGREEGDGRVGGGVVLVDGVAAGELGPGVGRGELAGGGSGCGG